MHNATTAPDISYYDYIIVGGGTAGCPLAATLSQNYSVLLLERGGSPYGNPNITNLSTFGSALSDLSPASPSQRFISEDGVINARARVLGGGSCLNAGFYSRAPPDYIRYIYVYNIYIGVINVYMLSHIVNCWISIYTLFKKNIWGFIYKLLIWTRRMVE